MNSIIELLRSHVPASHQSWFSDVLAITLGSFICWLIWKLIYSRLELLSSKTNTRWDDVFIQSLKTPISTMIWCWPAISSTGLIIQTYIDRDLDWISSLQTLLVIVIMTWITFRLVNNVEEEFASKKKYDVTTLQAIAKVARLFCAVLGVLTMMQSFGVSLSGLLTFGGVGGLIAGLAAKDLLSNFFGGVMVYFDRPFKVGDWIRSPDRAIEGTVERIGWRMTVIRTFDKRPLYVPNSVFSSIVVENPSRMSNRRIFETIGVRYSDHQSLAIIIDEVKTMLRNHPDIDASQTLIVNFNSFGPSSLDFFIYTFTKTVNWERYHVVKQAILMEILAIIHRHNADVAFPTQTLKLEQITDPQ